MTDREMLELAAKAAGIDWVASLDEGLTVGEDFLDVRLWNPLTSDGDALRLAVTIGLCVDVSYMNTIVTYEVEFDQVTEEHNNDPYAATRRAIVRAAAEIGRSLK